MKADVTSPLKITRMREATGPVDILVNNAGIPTTGFGELKLFVDTHPEDWEDAMRLNLGAVLHVTHAYAGAMVDQGWGRIVTIVSDAGRKGERFQAIYGAAKAGAMGFTRGLAAEVGPHGVTANCVALGTMKTGALEEALVQNPELETKMARHYTVPRLGRPEDPAVLVALAVQRRGFVDHRPDLSGRRRLLVRALKRRPGPAHDPCGVRVAGVSFGIWLRAVSQRPRAHGSGRKLGSRAEPPKPVLRGGTN